VIPPVSLRIVLYQLLDVGLNDPDLGEDLIGGGGPDERCGCRNPCPCRSGSVVVLAKDSAESVAPAYVQALDLVRFEQSREGSQGCGAGQGSVGTVLVVVRS
jgi:hypothetical protein